MGDNSGEELVTMAQRFCSSKRDWLVRICYQLLDKRDLPNPEQMAEDLAHDTYMRCGTISNAVWEGIKNKPGYIYKIAESWANEYYRESHREVATDPEDLASLSQGQNPADAEHSARIIKRVVNDLPASDQILFRLWYQFGYDSDEIATRLNISPENVRQRISRLKKKLRYLINGGDKTPPERLRAVDNSQTGSPPGPFGS